MNLYSTFSPECVRQSIEDIKEQKLENYVTICEKDIMIVSHLELDYLGTNILMTSAAVNSLFTLKLSLLVCYSSTIQYFLCNQDHINHLNEALKQYNKKVFHIPSIFFEVKNMFLNR